LTKFPAPDKLSLDNGFYCPKPECKRLCSGTASMHPKAIAAMATNQILGDQKGNATFFIFFSL